jgi:monoamine oxidase
MSRPDPDVIVVGGGFAGLRAARDLADAGRRVVLIEARERLGGRTWTRAFGGDGPRVELGGSWFTPEQREAPAELRRYGLSVRTYGPPAACRWRTGGVLRTGLPVPWEELNALEAALVTIATDARRLAEPGAADLRELSCAEYLDRLAPPPATRDFLTAWWVLIGGTEQAAGAVVDALAAIAGHGGVTGLLTTLRYAPVEGWSALAAALASHHGIDVRLGLPIAELHQDGDAIETRAADGSVVAARAAVVAVPVNVLDRIAFRPPLPPRTDEAVGSNAGAAVKLWLSARGVEPETLAVGAGEGLHWLRADRPHGDGALLAGFGPATPTFDPSMRSHVERALGAFFPDAELVDWDWHDWNADPFARGTWATATPGKTELLTHDRFGRHGRLVFATSDVAPREAGWIDGALAAGAAAADEVSALLG